MLYVNVGGPFHIVDTPHLIETWGQPVEIPEDLARGAIADGAHLLPKDEFDKLKFTPAELELSNARRQAGAPPEFHTKLAAAVQAARDYRDSLRSATAEDTASPRRKSKAEAPATPEVKQ